MFTVISPRSALLQLYRLGVLLAVVWIVRAHHVRLRIEGDAPVEVREVTGWFTNAVELKIDAGARGGFHVRAADGAELGYVIRTQPQGHRIVGYCGLTDTLVALDRALRWVPGGLLGFVLLVVMLPLDFDLAGIEPFDAYLIRAAGAATIVVALVGLVAAAFVPQAYCKYGCPTGALLEFGRARGAADRFGAREIAAALLVALAAVMSWKHAWIHAFLYGAAAS